MPSNHFFQEEIGEFNFAMFKVSNERFTRHFVFFGEVGNDSPRSC